eukprot:4822491-Karenia_brevis.AAC.1
MAEAFCRALGGQCKAGASKLEPCVGQMGFSAAISACEKDQQWQRVAPMHSIKHTGRTCRST